MPFFVICDLSSEMSTRTTRRIHATSETGTWYPPGTPTSIYTSVTIGVAQSVVFCVCVVFCKQLFLFHLAILSLFFFLLRLDFLVAFGIFKLVCPYILTLCQSSVGLRLRKGKNKLYVQYTCCTMYFNMIIFYSQKVHNLLVPLHHL